MTKIELAYCEWTGGHLSTDDFHKEIAEAVSDEWVVSSSADAPVAELVAVLKELLELGHAEGDFHIWKPLEKRARAAIALYVDTPEKT